MKREFIALISHEMRTPDVLRAQPFEGPVERTAEAFGPAVRAR